MFNEFKEFISRGNVIDMAVGIVVGGAFTSIVNSLVNDILTPVINMLTGKADVSDLSVQIGSATLNYGLFIQAIINFLIIAVAVFALVKAVNTVRNLSVLKKKEEEEAAAPAGPTQEELLAEIRDLLKAKK
ncbi:MAG TPA: large conductance mechanosensitive channel protein MscL [Candidatus Ornithomonoglobus intestinigallinarum]|uniref:Large-conductance mechanosensitive channel n=1 Tax=Candidatus Ornithomonoglobus intestinigallinarum TaxID=2840894 RepID=A0A9D1KRY2_9FIRM|nr:large conductance mechanosensitive channel protein MscL [Candidatus Ornithomonoglobus intestinigallinarum]